MNKNRSKIIIVLFILAAILSLSIFFIFSQFSSFIKTPLNPQAKEKIFIVKPGENLKSIAERLKKESLISNNTYFILFAKFKKADKKLQTGEYILSASKSPEQILGILQRGKVKLYKITIPEGLNINEVALLVEDKLLGNKTEFKNLC
ncbi:MAG: aminodeoxychorismate lyase, partial [Desulfobacula sp.]|nr:aminodeoxychorismate lyase [Desulfobacula sp.]